MNIDQIELSHREFLPYFSLVKNEFENEIPWFKKIKGIEEICNGNHFATHFKERLTGSSTSIVKPFIITEESSRIVGGITFFDRSPEIFLQGELSTYLSLIESEGFSYVTGLVFKDQFRSLKIGQKFLYFTLKKVLNDLPRMYGIVSHSELIPYYKAFGFKNEFFKEEKLWVITITHNSLKHP